ncbi:MAG: hypothetical protein MZU79_04485 [Anaerotruncus sp.]|nr:hypothetical protein [Anaerotruncus sp.]
MSAGPIIAGTGGCGQGGGGRPCGPPGNMLHQGHERRVPRRPDLFHLRREEPDRLEAASPDRSGARRVGGRRRLPRAISRAGPGSSTAGSWPRSSTRP